MAAPMRILFSAGNLNVFLFGLCFVRSAEPPKPRIAIIGTGIGGSTAAYYSRKLFGPETEIDVYEKDKNIGGRIAIVEIAGRKFNSGATILHPRNLHMKSFTDLLGLEQKTTSSDILGLYNGKEMVFEGSRYEVVTLAKLLWRYGYDLFKVNSWVEEMLKSFDNIYSLQEQGFAFSNVSLLLEAMSITFPELTQISIKSKLQEEKLGERFIDEMAMAALRVNYGQTTDVQAFVGSVCLAGVQSGLWSVAGGNDLVPQGLLGKAKVNFQQSEVKKITLREVDERLLYEAEAASPSGVQTQKMYDIVIIATPLHKGSSFIEFIDFPDRIENQLPEYHRTVATFVQGTPNYTKFGYQNLNDFPTALLTTDPDLFFNSISNELPVDSTKQDNTDTKPVYKVFSQKPLTDQQLNDLFLSYDEIQVVDWLAYPHYKSKETLPSFQLHDFLFYENAMEIAASAMETSAIAGYNTALLAYNNWYGMIEKIDQVNESKMGKTEL